jgi:hypothetical protein
MDLTWARVSLIPAKVRIVDADHMGVLIDRLSPREIGRLQDYLLPRIDDPNPGKKTLS